MRYIAIIAPHSNNPVTMEISKAKFENPNELDVINLEPIDGRWKITSKGNGILYVMPA